MTRKETIVTYKRSNNKLASEFIDALEQAPKTDVIDKIREEIEKLPTTKCTETRRMYMDADDFKKNVLAILDKYKKESEE